ncbi:MAG TPA: DinB family protein [Tepidisphaeraceae bacterium]|nr:DinB family protein [Tepidisphaeraceae bacterium]
MADETLLLTAKEIRGKTLRLLEGVTDEQSLWTPPGLQNHILWHAGHTLTVVEHLTFSPSPLPTQPTGYPQDWFALFNWQSKPTAETKYPSLSDVVAQLRVQLERVLAHINTLDGAALSRNIGSDEKPKNLRYTIFHGFHDEAGHQGEIHLLKKLIAKAER